MVIAVVAMRVVQVTVDEIVDVIAVRHRRMPASGAMHVVLAVCLAIMPRGAVGRIPIADVQRMLIHMVAVRMVQVPVVQIIDVTGVLDGSMSTSGAVLVGVTFVYLALAHRDLSFWKCVAINRRGRSTGPRSPARCGKLPRVDNRVEVLKV